MGIINCFAYDVISKCAKVGVKHQLIDQLK